MLGQCQTWRQNCARPCLEIVSARQGRYSAVRIVRLAGEIHVLMDRVPAFGQRHFKWRINLNDAAAGVMPLAFDLGANFEEREGLPVGENPFVVGHSELWSENVPIVLARQ